MMEHLMTVGLVSERNMNAGNAVIMRVADGITANDWVFVKLGHSKYECSV
jgi:hypothetical protein